MTAQAAAVGDGAPTDWVTGQMQPGQVRHYAACLYAAALLIPLAQQRLPDDLLLGLLTTSIPGRRLAAAPAQRERVQLTRMLLDEALVLCRDDEALLDLAASVYDVLDVLQGESDLAEATRRVLTRINRALVLADNDLR